MRKVKNDDKINGLAFADDTLFRKSSKGKNETEYQSKSRNFGNNSLKNIKIHKNMRGLSGNLVCLNTIINFQRNINPSITGFGKSSYLKLNGAIEDNIFINPLTTLVVTDGDKNFCNLAIDIGFKHLLADRKYIKKRW